MTTPTTTTFPQGSRPCEHDPRRAAAGRLGPLFEAPSRAWRLAGLLGVLLCPIAPLGAQTASAPQPSSSPSPAQPAAAPRSPLDEASSRAAKERAQGTAPVIGGAAASPAPAGAQAPAPAVKAATTPLLWKIEGPVPSYLYGTIHVPDQQVVQLPRQVEEAFAASAAVFTEISMDAGTQMGVMSKVLLPGDQTLGQLLGEPLYARFSEAVTRSLPKEAPPGMAAAITAMLGRMKPWAAMSQLALIEFLPDMMAGRKPLDAMLYERAKADGKETAALETVDEQLAVFEGFTIDEQIRMLEMTLDSMDEAHREGRSATRELIDAYISGDLAKLSEMATDSMRSEPELFRKFMARALDGRNRLMAERILARRAERADKPCFFAVGALHYAGDTGIVALLQKQGLKITRVER